MSLQGKYDISQEKSHKTPGQLSPYKNGESSSRNSGTSCSNADSGVASQEEDDIESSSKDFEISEEHNVKANQPSIYHYQRPDTNNVKQLSSEIKR